jgi:membrane protein DedA with SNARE-associated domain/rhodanese-related sulfurtransferase
MDKEGLASAGFMGHHFVSSATEFLIRHGYAVVFVWVLMEQAGLPIPSAPVLLAAGALAGLHRLSLAEVIALAMAACLFSDTLWFGLGARRGNAILRLICKLSLDPETCVSKTHSAYMRYGPASLLFAKFAPGLGSLGAPMAGMFGLSFWKFLILDAAGSVLWSGAIVGVGWAFHEEIEILADWLARFGVTAASVLVGGLAFFFGAKYVRRRRTIRALRVARITPAELKQLLDSDRAPAIIDLRPDFERLEGVIPGAIAVAAADLDSLSTGVIEGEIVFYCSCPGELESVQAAVRLKRRGATHVRPLSGGFAAWLEMGFPVEPGQPEHVVTTGDRVGERIGKED